MGANVFILDQQYFCTNIAPDQSTFCYSSMHPTAKNGSETRSQNAYHLSRRRDDWHPPCLERNCKREAPAAGTKRLHAVEGCKGELKETALPEAID